MIETEGDVMTLYVLLESGLGFPRFGEWISDILDDAYNNLPSSSEVSSEQFQLRFQKAVDERINYYKKQGLEVESYISPNTGENPRALEAVIEQVELNKNK